MTSQSDVAETARVAAVVDAVHRGTALHDAVGVSARAVDSLEQQAYRLYCAGRFEETAVLAEGIVALDVTRSYPRLLLGDIYAQRDEWARALKAFEGAMEADGESAFAAFKCGDALVRLGEFGRAAPLLARAIESAEAESSPWLPVAEGLLNRIESYQSSTE